MDLKRNAAKNLKRNAAKTSGLATATVRVPKKIAEITLCGALRFIIDDTMPFIKPTDEQIKNLHDIFCIDIKLLDEVE